MRPSLRSNLDVVDISIERPGGGESNTSKALLGGNHLKRRNFLGPFNIFKEPFLVVSGYV